MATYNFEGDLSGVSDRQSEFIYNIIQKLGYTNSKVTFQPVGKAGDNFASSVKRIIVEGEKGSLSLIGKLTPPGDDSQKHMVSLIFKNEHFMYMEVLPKLVQLQKSAGVPENEQLKYAKCYGSSTEQFHEIILLEDLKSQDYIILDKFQPLSSDCIKLILKNFATLHSLSFAMRHKDPDTFEYLKTNLTDMMALQASAGEMTLFMNELEEQVKSILENPHHKSLIKIVDTMSLAPKFSKMENESKHTVILQGDAWTNNMMFKMADGNPTESIMIDYQLSKNSSPVGDVMSIIFNCTDHETRMKYYYDWIDFYHSELDKSLLNFNLKANSVYPRDKLDADLKMYGKIIFSYSVFASSILIRSSEEAKELMENVGNLSIDEHLQKMVTVSSFADNTKILFKERIVGLINSFVELGLL